MDEKHAQTIAEFCTSHRISRASFYNLARIGKAPRIIKVGAKVIITQEASADWRREREAETAAFGAKAKAA